MKKICLFIYFLFASYFTNSQSLEGTWQLNTPLFANYESNYTFDDSGSFSYYPALYNTLQIIYSLNGNYVINGDSIYYTVSEVVVNSVNWDNIKIEKSKNVVSGGEWFWSKDGFDNIEGMHRDFPSTSNFWSVSYSQRRTIQVSPRTFAVFFEYVEDEERTLILEGHKLNYKYINIDGDHYYYIYGASDIDD